ncbi:hypothetical protein HD554DRAFT_1659739 [Boletus coccyginus]|nr:hypothetical protein HD554DRAFT_1659739 [Boletus coccyginus]
MVSFKLSPPHQYDNFFGDLVQKHKENIATATAGALIREEEQSKLAHGKKRGRKKKSSATGTTATQDVPAQFAVAPSSSTTNDSVLHRMKTLESVVSQLNDQVGMLVDENQRLKLDNRQLNDRVGVLEDENQRLKLDNRQLNDRVGVLEDENQTLKLDNRWLQGQTERAQNLSQNMALAIRLRSPQIWWRRCFHGWTIEMLPSFRVKLSS